MSRQLLLFVVVAALCAGEPVSRNWDSLQKLTASDRIRVIEVDNRLHEGFFISWSPESLAVQKKREVVQLDRTKVTHVYLVEKGSRARGALIGLGIGFGTGFAVGAAVAGKIADVNNPRASERMSAGAGIGAVFGGIGAGIGALSSGHRSVILYEKPKRQ